MTDPVRTDPAIDVRGLYDRWSDHLGVYVLVALASRPLRREAVAKLALSPGDRVLDVGCGPGVNFALLREAVGPDGEVVGVDVSGGMATRARERVRRNGWGNVSVVRGDVTAPGFPDGTFDAALATLALSTVPDPTAAGAALRAALRPDGRLAVLDGRLPDDGVPGALRPVLAPVYRRVAGFRPEPDLLAALGEAFPSVETVETYDMGLSFLALAFADGADGG